MREPQLIVADDLSSVLDKLYLQFGVWKMARAIAAAGWRHLRFSGSDRPYVANNLDDLPDRMLRDIGIRNRPGLFNRPAAPQWERWR